MKSEDREGLHGHGTGDVKIAPGTAGATPLPDGTFALAAKAVEDIAALSMAAKAVAEDGR